MEHRYGGDLSPPPRPPKPISRTQEFVQRPAIHSAARNLFDQQQQYCSRVTADRLIMHETLLQSSNTKTSSTTPALIETKQQRTNNDNNNTLRTTHTILPQQQSNGNFFLGFIFHINFEESSDCIVILKFPIFLVFSFVLLD